ncbi:MAG TPA: EVE domain-containing protein [Gemmatimonadaceae bacterium]|nr:EVE domain-containing protein [Gemmatimonadaceae bacterium]
MTAKRRWLVKSEPTTFSWQHLWKSPRRTTCWDGVRNFQARNYLRDQMQVGDPVFFYHSNADPTAIMGICEVVRSGYPDDTAFDKKSGHFDPKSDPANPTWYMVDLRAVHPLAHPPTLARLREERGLAHMVLLKKGSRLSVQPVTDQEWDIIDRIGEAG